MYFVPDMEVTPVGINTFINGSWWNNTRKEVHNLSEEEKYAMLPVIRDYVNGQESTDLHHDLYHLTLTTRLYVLAFMFAFIVVPSVTVFIVLFVKDRKKQRRYKQLKKQAEKERPDPRLPYSALLYRPVPSSTPSLVTSDGGKKSDLRDSKNRSVSFARNVVVTSTSSSLKSAPMPTYDDLDDDVFPNEDKNFEIDIKNLHKNNIGEKNNGDSFLRHKPLFPRRRSEVSPTDDNFAIEFRKIAHSDEYSPDYRTLNNNNNSNIENCSITGDNIMMLPEIIVDAYEESEFNHENKT